MSTTMPHGQLNLERRYQLLIESINDYAIYMLTPEGVVDSWNPGAQHFKGYTADDIIGQHFSRFYTPEDQAAGLPARGLSIARSEGKFEAEGWRVRKDGARFWAHVVIDPVYDESGALIGYAKITRDITDKKRVQDALRESERRFRYLVEGVTDYAIYMLSPTGEITNWNTGAERIKGYSADEVVGSHFSRFYTDDERAAEKPRIALETALREGRFEAEGWRIRKDGTRFWAHVVIDTVHDDDGNMIGFAKITRDITEKRQATELLEEARAALVQAQKMEAIGKLTGGIAHDFNNVLQGLMGNLELIRLRVALGQISELNPSLDAALSGVKRAAGLTHRLLAFARRQTLTPKPVNASSMASSMMELIQRTTGLNIEVEARLQDKSWWTLCDQNQLENALLNLVINSRDAMPDGGSLIVKTENVSLAAPRIAHASHIQPGEYVVLSVSDTGCGMTPEVLAQSCEPFFTTKPIGQGTGLGLATLHGFVTQSGGHVLIESKVDHGTTISLYLPRYEADENGEVLDGRGGVLPKAAIERKTVLIVDDEPAVLTLLTEILKQFGYIPLSATTAHEAMQRLQSGSQLDLLVSDVGLPGEINGRMLADEARRLYPDLNVLLITGFAEQTVLGNEMLPEGIHILTKPFTVDAFTSTVRRLTEE